MRRAVVEGVVRLDGQPAVVNAVAAKGIESLLRYLVSERGADPNQKDIHAIVCCLHQRHR